MQMQQGRIKKIFVIVSDIEPIHQRSQIKNRLLFKSKAIQSNDGKLSKTRFILTDQIQMGTCVICYKTDGDIRFESRKAINWGISMMTYMGLYIIRHVTIDDCAISNLLEWKMD